ncbi:MAG: hypothetical protein CM15mP1_1550 [Methanobacteriota archaeon]|nr:MAG: hypothetical protein CM15mP1_1550 [Euryarchaeota archaeon]
MIPGCTQPESCGERAPEDEFTPPERLILGLRTQERYDRGNTMDILGCFRTEYSDILGITGAVVS